MRPALLTPMRLLSGIVLFTVVCMLGVGLVADHLADVCLGRAGPSAPSRMHLIAGVTRALQRAEECRRGYIETGERSYLDGYRAACQEVDTSMDRLVGADAGAARRMGNSDGLRDLVHERLTDIGDALVNGTEGKGAEPNGMTEREMERIQKLMTALEVAEKADMTEELKAARARTIFHRDLVIALAGINLLFLAAAAVCASQIGKLYSLVTVCAWSKRVKCGDQWVPLEEFVEKRFGIRITHGISNEELEKWEPRASAAADAPKAA